MCRPAEDRRGWPLHAEGTDLLLPVLIGSAAIDKAMIQPEATERAAWDERRAVGPAALIREIQRQPLAFRGRQAALPPP